MTRQHAPGILGRLKEYKEFIAIVASMLAIWHFWSTDFRPFMRHIYGAADKADSAYAVAVDTRAIATQTRLEVDTVRRVLKDSMFARGTLIYHTDSMTRRLEDGQKRILERLAAGGIASIQDTFPTHIYWHPLHVAKFTIQ